MPQSNQNGSQVQGPWTDLALHTLGWKAFQDLCAHVCSDILNRPVEIYREAQDGGQDALFLSKIENGKAPPVVTTVQCKFSSKSDRHLKLSDLGRDEEEKIKALVQAGQASAYVLMTNMSVAGPVAVSIRRRLRELGVRHAHVFGKEFLTRTIRSSAKLRALVPRVYGLGDLSTILDERGAAQTRALLGHMLPTLRVYVPTKPHVNAIRALQKHSIVLLLGDPATGKSTIAAVLSTIRAENPGRKVIKVDSPFDLIDRWNPNEPNGFYWIDDAFGPNQMRDDFVDQWIAIMPKLLAAIGNANQFVITSRRHIYEEAKPKLGSRNHPAFKDGRAIVDVGNLTLDEKKQILYNHIKAGDQPFRWKQLVKPHLEALAAEWSFIPEIARRLADPVYTARLTLTPEALIRFVREPKEHLLQTIKELSKPHRAALTLVFLHRGLMPVGAPLPKMQQLIENQFSVDSESLGNSLTQLKDSFLVQRKDGNTNVWTFKHPTIADAISSMLGETSGMTEIYLRGTKPENIAAEVVCSNAPTVRDAVLISEAFEPLLIERLLETPDSPSINRLLFSFLSVRASNRVLEQLVAADTGVFDRESVRSYQTNQDPRVRALAKAHRLGLLSETQRIVAADHLESVILDDIDTSILESDDLLSIFTPTELLRLPTKIKEKIFDRIPDAATEIADEADIDSDPDSIFEDLESSLTSIQELFDGDESVTELVNSAYEQIEETKDIFRKKRREYMNSPEEEEDDWDWREYAPSQAGRPATAASKEQIRAITEEGPPRPRSVFSDVDD